MALDFESVALHALSQAQCCLKSCLYRQTSCYDDTIRLVRECREDVYNLNRAQKRDFIRDVVRSCIIGNSRYVECFKMMHNLGNGTERLNIEWKIKTMSVTGICR